MDGVRIRSWFIIGMYATHNAYGVQVRDFSPTRLEVLRRGEVQG